MTTNQTDAEKLAAAIAEVHASQERIRLAQEAEAPIVAAAAEAAKAARLPSAVAAQTFFETPASAAILAQLEALGASNLDDVTGGCKRAIQRVAESWRAAGGTASQRVAALQPTPAAPPEPQPSTETEA